LPSSAPIGSFHPTRFCPCWAHWAGAFPPGALEAALDHREHPHLCERGPRGLRARTGAALRSPD
jgi:hypothetical protein